MELGAPKNQDTLSRLFIWDQKEKTSSARLVSSFSLHLHTWIHSMGLLTLNDWTPSFKLPIEQLVSYLCFAAVYLPIYDFWIVTFFILDWRTALLFIPQPPSNGRCELLVACALCCSFQVHPSPDSTTMDPIRYVMGDHWISRVSSLRKQVPAAAENKSENRWCFKSRIGQRRLSQEEHKSTFQYGNRNSDWSYSLSLNSRLFSFCIHQTFLFRRLTFFAYPKWSIFPLSSFDIR